MVRPMAFVLLIALSACSREKAMAPEPFVAQPAQPAPPSRPAEAGGAPLAPELAARLVRAHSPVLGPAMARVTLVEFLDPACEACAGFAPLVRQVLLVYPTEVRVVVRYAAFHRGSDEAVRILDAAQRQKKFEPVLDALFDGQAQWASHQGPNIEQAWKLARAAGLDAARARRDARSAATDAVLKQDGEDVIALRVNRTPTIFVNGRPLEDFGGPQLLALVRQEVERAPKTGGQ